MPCNTVTYNSIDFEAVQNHLDLLAEAMRLQGFTVTRSGQTLSFYGKGYSGTYGGGQFMAEQGFEQHTTEIKRGFAVQAVKAAAKKHGWEVVQKNGQTTGIRRRV
jgi:hypothetical protein